MKTVSSDNIKRTPKLPSMKSRNIAVLSIFGVFSGTWLVFRALSPKKNAYVVSDEERAIMRGGDGNQTSQGNKTARAPRSLG